MHTFEMICNIYPDVYLYLKNNLPSLRKVSEYVECTNFYLAKGITQIELHRYSYKYNGTLVNRYYLVLRCNPSIIMGDSKIFSLDMEKYTSAEIITKIQKRLYEINQFRYIRLDKLPFQLFRAKRIDVAEDINVSRPDLIIWLCNMSFPYKYCNMKRKPIKKNTDTLYFESCCFCSGSREFNIYSKWSAMKNTEKYIGPEEEERIMNTVRMEIQIKKKGISYMATKLPTKRELETFLQKDFCHNYMEEEIKDVFSIELYVSREKVLEVIGESQYKPYVKAVLISIIDTIQQFKGLYALEKAIENDDIHTPPQYGNLRSFRKRWLVKIRKLGIQPIVIPDYFKVDEVPSMIDILMNNRKR